MIVGPKKQSFVWVSKFEVQKGAPNVLECQNTLLLMAGKAGHPAAGAVQSVGVATQNSSHPAAASRLSSTTIYRSSLRDEKANRFS
jgi:hypothetical protein